jgi:hypothetical protein
LAENGNRLHIDFDNPVEAPMVNRRSLAVALGTLGFAFATFAGAQEIDPPSDASTPAPAVNLTQSNGEAAEAAGEAADAIPCGNVAPEPTAPQPPRGSDVRCRQAGAIAASPAPSIVAGR